MIQKPVESTSALVLTSTPYKENSAIVTLAGEEGLFSVMARGVYKPKSQLKPLLITGNLVKVEYALLNKDMKAATSLEVVTDASELMSDYPTSVYLLYLSELSVSLFGYGDRFPFEGMKKILYHLQEKKNVLSMTLLTLGQLYTCLGINMETHHCIRCRKTKDIVSYSLEDGGFLCSSCLKENEQPVKDTMDLFVLKYAFSPLSEEILDKEVPKNSGIRIFASLNDHLVDYFDLKPMKSFSLLLDTLS